MAERVGFEPTELLHSPVFKTGAFDHSATSPAVNVVRIISRYPACILE